MYESYFGLTERPFSIAPDPQYLYMSARHKEAMAHLSYGLSQGGCFIVLTGEVGTGKTTLCRNLMTDLPDNVDLALILNANINESELLQTICDELKISYEESHSQKQLLDLINQHLLSTFAKNRHTVLIIDEAQLLSRDVLEQIRLLTNLETTKHKLLQIILIGQPELNDMLMRNDLRQLAQRVTARYHLGELKRSEIEEYVNYRLGVAGCKQPLFSSQALSKLHQLTDGIPRKINVLADHALLSAYALKQRMVDSTNIRESAKEVFFTTNPSPTKAPIRKKWWLLALLLILLNIAFWWIFIRSDNDAAIISQQSSVTPAPVSSAPSSSEPPTVNQEEPLAETQNTITPDAESEVAALENSVLELNPQTDVIEQSSAQSDENLFEIENPEPNQNESILGSVTVSSEYLDTDEDVLKAVQDSAGTTVQTATQLSEVYPTISEQTEFGRILETSADLTGRITAFRALVKLWGEELPSQLFNPVCDEVQVSGLKCIFFVSWDQLLRFNRPAVLVLNHNNQRHRVIVEVVDGDAAEVRVGESIYRISVEELKSRWQGNSAVLVWRPSKAGSSFLQQGETDPLMPVIRAYVNQALVQSQLPTLSVLDSVEFDQDLSQKVLSLQTSYNIVQDSKIGNETYLLLNELTQPNLTPVLRSRAQ